MYKILIAEDEEPIANLIAMNLKKNGFQCEIAYDGRTAADKMQENTYDLGIFDIMLPVLDGYELLQYAKSLHIPVIFLTAKGEVNERVKGLRQGADDYMTKPFELAELIARVETVLRRYHGERRKYQIGDLCIDTDSRMVMKKGRLIDLTYKEYELLMMFVEHPNVALYREAIFERVWESQYLGESRTVDLHVQRLRKKTGLNDEIVSVYKVGYCFVWKEEL